MEKTKEFLDTEFTEMDIKKAKIANFLGVFVALSAVCVAIGFLTGSSALLISFAIVNLLFGPLTLFFYLREVKKGVFKEAEDE
jgi:hypothetical protein